VARAASGPTLGTSTRDEPVAKMFAELAPEYDRMNAVITFGLAQSWRRELVRRALPAGRCLDFGCGTGRSTRFLKRLGYEAVGVDIAPHMLAKARDRDPGGDYRLLAAHDLETLPAHTYDLVLAAFTFDSSAEKSSWSGHFVRSSPITLPL